MAWRYWLLAVALPLAYAGPAYLAGWLSGLAPLRPDLMAWIADVLNTQLGLPAMPDRGAGDAGGVAVLAPLALRGAGLSGGGADARVGVRASDGVVPAARRGPGGDGSPWIGAEFVRLALNFLRFAQLVHTVRKNPHPTH